jgi:hypothetical protein
MASAEKIFFPKSFNTNVRVPNSMVLFHPQPLSSTKTPRIAINLSHKISMLHYHLDTIYSSILEPNSVRLFFRTLNNIRCSLKSFLKRQSAIIKPKTVDFAVEIRNVPNSRQNLTKNPNKNSKNLPPKTPSGGKKVKSNSTFNIESVNRITANTNTLTQQRLTPKQTPPTPSSATHGTSNLSNPARSTRTPSIPTLATPYVNLNSKNYSSNSDNSDTKFFKDEGFYDHNPKDHNFNTQGGAKTTNSNAHNPNANALNTTILHTNAINSNTLKSNTQLQRPEIQNSNELNSNKQTFNTRSSDPSQQSPILNVPTHNPLTDILEKLAEDVIHNPFINQQLNVYEMPKLQVPLERKSEHIKKMRVIKGEIVPIDFIKRTVIFRECTKGNYARIVRIAEESLKNESLEEREFYCERCRKTVIESATENYCEHMIEFWVLQKMSNLEWNFIDDQDLIT